MFRYLFPALIVASFAASPPCALAQDDTASPPKTKNRTLKYADTAPRPVQGTEVVRPPQVTALKSWPLDVSSLPAKGYPNITLIAESAQLLSNGTMIWTFSVYNKGEEGINFLFSFGRSYLADDQGEKFNVTAQEFPPNNGEYTKLGLHAGTRKRFWLAFKAPVRPTSAFRVGMILEGGFSTQPNAFAPFLVTLNQPLFLDNGVFELEEEFKVPGENLDGKKGVSPTQRPRNTMLRLAPRALKSGAQPMKGPKPDGVLAPKDPEEQANDFLTLSTLGLTVNGSILPKSGGTMRGRLVFLPRSPHTDLVEARIIWTGMKPAREVEVVGGYFEDLSTPSGLVLKLFDFGKVRYSFTLDGNNLNGEDSLGHRYNLVISRSEPR
jgi:hypothetical protein